MSKSLVSQSIIESYFFPLSCPQHSPSPTTFFACQAKEPPITTPLLFRLGVHFSSHLRHTRLFSRSNAILSNKEMVSGDDATEVPGSEIHSDGDEYFASHFGGEDSSGNDSDSVDEYSDEDLPRRSSQQYSTDPRGFTPLMEAAVKGTVADIRALIQAGVDVNEGRQGRITALHIAAETGNELVLAALIRAGGNVNAWLDDGSAPLHCAAVHGHVEVVEALICAGAKLDDVRDSTYTPLFLAAAEGHGAVVVALLNAGAKLNAVNFKLQALNPNPKTLNLKPQTLNPKPSNPQPYCHLDP